MCSASDLNQWGGIDGGGGVRGGGGEGGDDLGGGLDAADERGNEDSVNRETEKVPESPTRIGGPNQAVLIKGRVERAGGGGDP